jgi:phospholipase/lecithinase/hemolysin
MIKELNAYYPGEFLVSKFNGEPLYADSSHLTQAGHQLFSEYFLGILKSKIPN